MKKQLGLLILFSLLLVSGVFGAYRFYEPYYGGYGYGYGFGYYFDTFLDFLEDNEFLVDAIVFLVIFLIVSKKVFSSFSEEKSLYVVIGIALTIGIMMYERRTGYSFIINSGWLSMVVLFGLIAYIMSTGTLTGLRMVSLGVIGFVAVSYFSVRFPQLYYVVPPFIPVLLMIGFFIMLVYGFLKLFTERGEGGVIDTLYEAYKKRKRP